jgi:hypothetical protein
MRWFNAVFAKQEERNMLKYTRLLAFGAALTLQAMIAQGEVVWEYRPSLECRFGGDLRLRLEHYDRDAKNPQNTTTGNPEEYLRNRTRIWGCIELSENMMLYGRIANQLRKYSSKDGDDDGLYDYKAGDEVYIDNLYLDWHKIADSNWSLRLGRQDFVLGNGLIVLEGTPYDAGRSIYFDGVVAKWAKEDRSLTLFSFYNDYKDRLLPIINDQDRPLRAGNQWVLGANWTQALTSSANLDLYTVHVEMDDDTFQAPASKGNADDNLTLDTVGLRLFGNLSGQTSYSLEMARQFGELSDTADFTGMIVDARLAYQLPETVCFQPKLSCRYTFMSGNDDKSTDEYEGYYPILAGYPMFEEEVTLFTFKDFTGVPGSYSNLNRLETRAALRLNARTSLAVAWALLVAERGETGSGDTYGQSLYANLKVKVTDALSLGLQACGFFAGDYYADGQDGEWVRFQADYAF